MCGQHTCCCSCKCADASAGTHIGTRSSTLCVRVARVRASMVKRPEGVAGAAVGPVYSAAHGRTRECSGGYAKQCCPSSALCRACVARGRGTVHCLPQHGAQHAWSMKILTKDCARFLHLGSTVVLYYMYLLGKTGSAVLTSVCDRTVLSADVPKIQYFNIIFGTLS